MVPPAGSQGNVLTIAIQINSLNSSCRSYLCLVKRNYVFAWINRFEVNISWEAGFICLLHRRRVLFWFTKKHVIKRFRNLFHERDEWDLFKHILRNSSINSPSMLLRACDVYTALFRCNWDTSPTPAARVFVSWCATRWWWCSRQFLLHAIPLKPYQCMC